MPITDERPQPPNNNDRPGIFARALETPVERAYTALPGDDGALWRHLRYVECLWAEATLPGARARTHILREKHQYVVAQVLNGATWRIGTHKTFEFEIEVTRSIHLYVPGTLGTADDARNLCTTGELLALKRQFATLDDTLKQWQAQ